MAVAYSSSILYGRPNLTAVALEIHHALVDETVAFAAQQHRYGSPLCELPTIKQKLGQMQSRLMTAGSPPITQCICWTAPCRVTLN
nr:acyl-CoA dehydrogenase family protein [Mesorhizobium sp.]